MKKFLFLKKIFTPLLILVLVLTTFSPVSAHSANTSCGKIVISNTPTSEPAYVYLKPNLTTPVSGPLQNGTYSFTAGNYRVVWPNWDQNGGSPGKGKNYVDITVVACTTETPKKVYVCKYVGRPGVDERLQTGQNPIKVSVNAIPEDPIVIGSYFADAQGRSFVLGFVPMTPEPTRDNCPVPETPTDTPVPTETTPPPEETTPPVETTEPPVETTEPPVETTEPPVETTEPPVETTEPPAETDTPEATPTPKPDYKYFDICSNGVTITQVWEPNLDAYSKFSFGECAVIPVTGGSTPNFFAMLWQSFLSLFQ